MSNAPSDPLQLDPVLRAQVAEDCDRSGNLRHKRDEVRRAQDAPKPRLRPSSWKRVDAPEVVCRATVIGIDPLENDEIVRVPCNTVGETAATVARLILHGFPYVHVDNDPVLDARREASSTAL